MIKNKILNFFSPKICYIDVPMSNCPQKRYAGISSNHTPSLRSYRCRIYCKSSRKICRRNLLAFFLHLKNSYFHIFLCRCERKSLPGLLNMFRHFRFRIKIHLIIYWTNKTLPILCGPPISVEMKINYPYLHGWWQKYKSARMWAYRIPGSWTLLFLPFFSYHL